MKLTRRRRALLIIALILLLPVLYVLGEHWVGTRALKRWEETQRRSGRATDIEGLRPKPVPRESNVQPQFSVASGQLSANQNLRTITPVAMRFIEPGKAVPSIHLTNWIVKLQTPRSHRTNFNWVKVRDELATIQQPLQEARAALQQGRLDSGLNYHQALSIRMFHLPRFKSSAVSFSIAARSALNERDLTGASENIAALLALTRNLHDEPIVISQVVRIAVGAIAAAATWEALQVPGWTDAQLAALQEQWGSIAYLSAVAPALEMERAMVHTLYRAARKSNSAANQFLAVDFSPAPPATTPIASFPAAIKYAFQHPDDMARQGLYVPLWQFGWSYADEMNYLRSTDLLLAAARQAFRDKSQLPARQAEQQLEYNETNRFILQRLRLNLSSTLASSLATITSKATDAETQKELVIAAIGIARYRQREGKLPASLQVLIPDFLPSLPRDYGDGATLRYRVGETGTFTLYGVGRNGTDDGGDPNPLNVKEDSFHYLRARDVVWPATASPQQIAESGQKL